MTKRTSDPSWPLCRPAAAVVVGGLAVLVYGCAQNGAWWRGHRVRTFKERPKVQAPTTVAKADHPPPTTPDPAAGNIDPANEQILEELDQMVQAYEASRHRDPAKPAAADSGHEIDSSSMASKIGPRPPAADRTPALKTASFTPKPKPWHVRPTPKSPAKPSQAQPQPAPAENAPAPKAPPTPKKADRPKPSAKAPTNTSLQIAEIRPIRPPTAGKPDPSAHDSAQLANYPMTAQGISNPARLRDPLAELVKRLETKVDVQPADVGTRLQLSLLYGILGKWEKALAHAGDRASASTSDRFSEDMVKVLKLFSDTTLSPPEQANRALTLVRQIEATLKRQADLRIVDFKLCSAVDSFSSYQTMPAGYFKPGRSLPVVVYVELDNLTSRYLADRKKHRTLLAMTIELIGEKGRVLFRRRYDKIEDFAHKPRRDFYIAPKPITLPPMQPGLYIVRVTVDDRLGNKTNQANIRLDIPTY